MVEWYAIRIKKGHDLKLSPFWFTSKESLKWKEKLSVWQRELKFFWSIIGSLISGSSEVDVDIFLFF